MKLHQLHHLLTINVFFMVFFVAAKQSPKQAIAAVRCSGSEAHRLPVASSVVIASIAAVSPRFFTVRINCRGADR